MDDYQLIVSENKQRTLEGPQMDGFELARNLEGYLNLKDTWLQGMSQQNLRLWILPSY